MPTSENLLLSNQLRITIRGYIRMLRKADEIEPDKASTVAKLLKEYIQIKKLEMELEPREPSYYQLLDSENGPPMEPRRK